MLFLNESQEEEILTGMTALVTGASQGLGKEIAKILASKGCNLILVGHNEEALQIFKEELSENYRVATAVYPVDLTVPGASLILFHNLQTHKHQVDLLINAASVCDYGEFLSQKWTEILEMFELNVIAATHLTHLYAKEMALRKHGYILLVSSYSSHVPAPYVAAFAATKSFISTFGENIGMELQNSGVSLTVVTPCLGEDSLEYIVTPPKHDLPYKGSPQPIEEIAAGAVSALLHKKVSYTPGWINRAKIFLCKITPRFIRNWSAGIKNSRQKTE